MTIGINAAAAVKRPRTGVEEYTYQLIKHLTMLPESREHRFLLYVPSVNIKTKIYSSSGATEGSAVEKFSTRSARSNNNYFDFPLPPNFEIKILRWPLPFLWTQIRLAWELWRRKPDALFVPAHILPLGAPKNSIVAIHGLEYEYFPEHYPLWRRLYLCWSTKRAARRAKKIIAVSENTKKDLVKLYGVEAGKLKVVHHGVIFKNPKSQILNSKQSLKPYILYLGRIETKKNVQGILAAYKILKEEYGVPHELVLAGAPGYGYENLKLSARGGSALGGKIIELGYVSDDAKWQLLSEASIFLFPSFYEGFGLPVLEAQSVGVPVVASVSSCLPEIAGDGALFVNPKNFAQIAEAVKQIIDDTVLRDKLRQSGFENIKRFSWAKCARETLKVATRD